MPATIEFVKPREFAALTRIMRIRGVDVYFHWTVFLVALLILLNAGRKPWMTLTALLCLSLLLLHESGHLIAAQRLGTRVREIRLYPIFGLCLLDAPGSRFDHFSAEETRTGRKENRMCSKRRDINAELDGIFEGLLDSIEHAPAEEVAEDARAAGRDIASMAADAKRAALAGLKRFEQKKLNAARRICKCRAARNLSQTLPATPEDRRNKFHEILASNRELSERLTIQYRDFQNISDDDVSVLLEELCELGVFGR